MDPPRRVLGDFAPSQPAIWLLDKRSAQECHALSRTLRHFVDCHLVTVNEVRGRHPSKGRLPHRGGALSAQWCGYLGGSARAPSGQSLSGLEAEPDLVQSLSDAALLVCWHSGLGSGGGGAHASRRERSRERPKGPLTMRALIPAACRGTAGSARVDLDRDAIATSPTSAASATRKRRKGDWCEERDRKGGIADLTRPGFAGRFDSGLGSGSPLREVWTLRMKDV